MSSLYPVDDIHSAERCENTRKNEFVKPIAEVHEGIWIVENDNEDPYMEYERNLTNFSRYGE